MSRYMFVQNFIKLSAAVHELSCAQRVKTPTKTVLSVATVDSSRTN